MKRGFAAMERELVRDGSIPESERLLLLILISYTREQQICWPSHKTLATDLGASDRTVKRLLVNLRARGLIEWRARTREDGGVTSCEYRILTPSPHKRTTPQDTGVLPPQDTDAPPPRTLMSHQEVEAVEVEPTEEKTPSPRKRGGESADDPRFVAFWAEYPKKVDKKAAVKTFFKALKEGADPDAVTAAAARYRRHVAEKEDRYIKHPTTWLNHGCWDDQYEETAPPRRRRESSLDALDMPNARENYPWMFRDEPQPRSSNS